ncbi:hypothetical protein CLV98_1087 [Dyadobacter jejuensis]|uniref:Four-helix bundle copper-binding protein n=1 Tax=Dyadobacter jejuensis TaxID=1082580 RepID=A0A316AII1_9BACT|nr:four-helix bundle copper-binding protein [Dyadobacter jejuensis]PWJ57088.1 hypothetical protein CLV98_1087 [Dyadobacter jejuensis]
MKHTNQDFQKVIDACAECAVTCTQCATACLQEENVAKLVPCIRLDMACAALCRSVVELLSLGSTFSAHLCRICVDVCLACATECEKNGEMGIRECAEACRRCALVCEEVATAA